MSNNEQLIVNRKNNKEVEPIDTIEQEKLIASLKDDYNKKVNQNRLYYLILKFCTFHSFIDLLFLCSLKN
jgi:hypothetical protein